MNAKWNRREVLALMMGAFARVVTAKTQYNLTNAREYFEEHLCVGDYYDEGHRVAGEWIGTFDQSTNERCPRSLAASPWSRTRHGEPGTSAGVAGTHAVIAAI